MQLAMLQGAFKVRLLYLALRVRLIGLAVGLLSGGKRKIGRHRAAIAAEHFSALGFRPRCNDIRNCERRVHSIAVTDRNDELTALVTEHAGPQQDGYLQIGVGAMAFPSSPADRLAGGRRSHFCPFKVAYAGG